MQGWLDALQRVGSLVLTSARILYLVGLLPSRLYGDGPLPTRAARAQLTLVACAFGFALLFDACRG
ncbi:MAG: hypothetical protein AAF624_08525 [Bacteroidota bacterium]